MPQRERGRSLLHAALCEQPVGLGCNGFKFRRSRISRVVGTKNLRLRSVNLRQELLQRWVDDCCELLSSLNRDSVGVAHDLRHER